MYYYIKREGTSDWFIGKDMKNGMMDCVNCSKRAKTVIIFHKNSNTANLNLEKGEIHYCKKCLREVANQKRNKLKLTEFKTLKELKDHMLIEMI